MKTTTSYDLISGNTCFHVSYDLDSETTCNEFIACINASAEQGLSARHAAESSAIVEATDFPSMLDAMDYIDAVWQSGHREF